MGRSRPRSSRSRAWARSSSREWPPSSKKFSSRPIGLDLEQLAPDAPRCDCSVSVRGPPSPVLRAVSRGRSPSLVARRAALRAVGPAEASGGRGDRGEQGLQRPRASPPPWPRSARSRWKSSRSSQRSPRARRSASPGSSSPRGRRRSRSPPAPAGARPRRPRSSGRRRGSRRDAAARGSAPTPGSGRGARTGGGSSPRAGAWRVRQPVLERPLHGELDPTRGGWSRRGRPWTRCPAAPRDGRRRRPRKSLGALRSSVRGAAPTPPARPCSA